MEYRPKILAFAGSLRQGSYNKLLVQNAICGLEEAGASVTYIDLKDYPLPLYNGDIENSEGLPVNAQRIKELMWQHDGFIIASPEYNGSISAVLKNVIDWASRPSKAGEAPLSCFADKVALIISASPGNLGGLRGLVHLRCILENIRTLVLPDQKAISKAHEAFTGDGKLKNEEDRLSIEALGKKLVDILIKLQRK